MARNKGILGHRGIAIPLAVAAMVLFAILVGFLYRSAHGELNLVAKSVCRRRARLIAESALEAGAAAILQKEFTGRWYKGCNQGPWGFWGAMEGTLNGGTFRLVAEDIINDVEFKSDDKGFSADALKVQKLTYNRIDLFARGTYDGVSVVLYKALVIHPEEKVYDSVWEKITDEQGRVTGQRLVSCSVR